MRLRRRLGDGSQGQPPYEQERPLRRGDVVVVRTPAEILATLDSRACLNQMPFMPEMIQFCGRKFTVAARAEKVCDTLRLQSRRLESTVLLADVRCDGSGHGGCEAECLLYWNEAWLRRVGSGTESSVDAADVGDDQLRDLSGRFTLDSGDGRGRYSCQATEMVAASELLSTWSLWSYLNEYANGNVGVRKFVRVMARAMIVQPLHRFRLLKMPPVRGSSRTTPPSKPLSLQPGELVRVKSRREIEMNLTDKGKNYGLWFDREMIPYCGETLRVRRRVHRIIDEFSGEMLEMKRDCISLEGGVCSGERSTGRFFCPRAIYSYYREGWLERVDEPQLPITASSMTREP